jgi:hypothetical protein
MTKAMKMVLRINESLKQLRELSLDKKFAMKGSTSSTPDFKFTPSTADGPVSDNVMKFGQDLLDLLSTAYDESEKILTSEASDEDQKSEISDIITSFITNAQELAESDLPSMFLNLNKEANSKLKKKGVKPQKLSADNPTILGLVAYVKHEIEKCGTILQVTVQSEIFKSTYFNLAYPKKD